MCGFSGFVYASTSTSWKGDLASIVRKMAEQIVHRGPDDSGVWCDNRAGVAFGHRRLSILDLSSTGHQPMHSSSGRYVIAYNGEVYNYRELRGELDGIGCSMQWRGHSDTEVILAAIEMWGLENSLKRFVGMFAFALWDRSEHALYLARDRMGEKPLYYGWQKDTFLFGSELKALKVHPNFTAEINRDVLTLYLRHNFIPAPYSIYSGIKKLTPGSYVKLQGDLLTNSQLPVPITYWSLSGASESVGHNSYPSNDREAVLALEERLRASVSGQMVADVPLGAFLSGGIDSSVVAALMQALSDRPIRTFSIGFHEDAYNEAQYAKVVANHLGTDHTELYLTSEDAMAAIPRLPLLYDEPFSDPSQIPTLLVSQLARDHVTVSLTGDGGDELFCGYTRYQRAASIWNKVGWLPYSFRRSLGRFLKQMPASFLNGSFFWLAPLMKQFGDNSSNVGSKIHEIGNYLDIKSPNYLYERVMSYWRTPQDIVLGASQCLSMFSSAKNIRTRDDLMNYMMEMDILNFLADGILVKVDRAAMGVSLETRVPLLDHRVVEYAHQLPLSMKVRDGESKWLLRQLLYKYVPKELVDRPKMGFGVPIDLWLRGPLREWAEELLDNSRLKKEGFFAPDQVRKKWEEHVSGKRDWSYCLWSVLMFQQWNESQ